MGGDLIKTILLDMDGVLWRGSEPALDVKGLFAEIHELGCQVFCVTNNSTKSVAMYQESLEKFGVDLAAEQFVTSAVATAAYLVERYPPGSSLYLIGEEGLKDTIRKDGFQLAPEESGEVVRAVVVGLDRQLTYQKLNQGVQYLRFGADLIGTNPDKTIPTPRGPAPGAGALISAVEASTGMEALIIGKPAGYLFDLALSRAGCHPGEALMIGDRLETDILGAQQRGIRTGLVLSGISSREEAESWRPAPDRIAPTAAEIIQELRANGRELI